jgi:hypothetical protein
MHQCNKRQSFVEAGKRKEISMHCLTGKSVPWFTCSISVILHIKFENNYNGDHQEDAIN